MNNKLKLKVINLEGINAGYLGKILLSNIDQCFQNFNVRINHLGILAKWTF